MSATDKILTRYVGEIEEHQKFIDGLVEAAEADNRDLKPRRWSWSTRKPDRIGECQRG